MSGVYFILLQLSEMSLYMTICHMHLEPCKKLSSKDALRVVIYRCCLQHHSSDYHWNWELGMATQDHEYHSSLVS